MKGEPLIFEKDTPGRRGVRIPCFCRDLKKIEDLIPSKYLRDDLPLPSLSELEVIRHYTRLSQLNFSIDTNFYPLGSCTMKYNPKINEEIANWQEFSLHPYQNLDSIQGILEVMYNLQNLLCEITGMDAFSLQPCAGAHGELTGMLIIKKFHTLRGDKRRFKVLVPDSSHGTNPATCSMCGYKVVHLKSNKEGMVDVDILNKEMDEEVAGLMLTNPNTLGLFEERILDIAEIVHKKGGLLYYDGANLNALLGITKIKDMGFDVMHVNLHKTFSTPHGGGGPGAGPVGVVEKLKDFLPVPVVEKTGSSKFRLNYNLPHSIGKVHSFYGNILVMIKAYCYILMLGREGLKRVSYYSVLNANYIRKSLKEYFYLPFDKNCMHEVVFSAKFQKERGVNAFDIAKRLIDYGIHPPTIYFPLIVNEALMIEPTETESKSTLDYFIDTMIKIDKETQQNPHLLKEAPHSCVVKRLDEVFAARNLDLRWHPPKSVD
ncbi:MAG: aminomethyl-transferring glycine dehydrogenase subunit GcvPB [Thermoplasmata archaeon]|nr:MAG: aminomethyl-transferring glycine dehydrogenase subunit GcvPB [Thermoplasmata archaeon]